NDSLFKRLCDLMEEPSLIEDTRFTTDIERGKNESALKEVIEAWLANYTAEEAVEMINKVGVPSSTILNIQEISDSEHIKIREMLVEIEHPVAGKTRIPGNPVKFSETPAIIEQHSPMLGQDNQLKENYAKD